MRPVLLVPEHPGQLAGTPDAGPGLWTHTPPDQFIMYTYNVSCVFMKDENKIKLI